MIFDRATGAKRIPEKNPGRLRIFSRSRPGVSFLGETRTSASSDTRSFVGRVDDCDIPTPGTRTR